MPPTSISWLQSLPLALTEIETFDVSTVKIKIRISAQMKEVYCIDVEMDKLWAKQDVRLAAIQNGQFALSLKASRGHGTNNAVPDHFIAQKAAPEGQTTQATRGTAY